MSHLPFHRTDYENIVKMYTNIPDREFGLLQQREAPVVY